MLRRKLWRELRQSALLLIAVGAIMAVGVTCFIGLQSAYFNLDEARDRYDRQGRMADFWVELKKAPETELQERMRIPGVGQWRARIQFNATVDLPEMAEPINA